jgi:hypothetical protein
MLDPPIPAGKRRFAPFLRVCPLRARHVFDDSMAERRAAVHRVALDSWRGLHRDRCFEIQTLTLRRPRESAGGLLMTQDQ